MRSRDHSIPSRVPSETARLPRNVIVLSWVSFFQDAASEMLYPVLPLFLTSVLGAGPAAVGLIEGVAEGTASALKGVSGRLADRMKRRPLVAAGYGLSSISKGLIALATGWPLVLFCRALDRAGKGLRTSPRDALIASATPPELRGRAFGFHRAADTAGAVLGPLIGLALYELLDHQLRPLFGIAVIPALVSTSLIAFVHETPGTPARSPSPHAGGPLPRGYWKTVVILTAFALANFSDALIILRAKQLGLAFVPLMLAYTLYNASYALLSYPAGSLSDRVPKQRVFAAGIGVFAVAYLGFAFAPGAAWVWPLLIIYGAYAALTDGVGKAWISGLVSRESAGTALGYYQGAGGVASVIAGVWAGLLWGSDGRLPFILSGVAAAVIALVLARVDLRDSAAR